MLADGSAEAQNALARLERFADVKNSVELVTENGGILNAGTKSVLAMAHDLANQGEVIQQFGAPYQRLNRTGDLVDSDIDIITNRRCIEMKSGSVPNVGSTNEETWLFQLEMQITYSLENRLAPALGVLESAEAAARDFLQRNGYDSVVSLLTTTH